MIFLKQLISIVVIVLIAGCPRNTAHDDTFKLHYPKGEYFRLVVLSCAKFETNKTQTAWRDIKALKPDLLLFLGDIVYLDEKRRNGRSMEQVFAEQWNEPNFKNLIKDVPYFATWDDHDSGANNMMPKTANIEKRGYYQKAYQEARISFSKRIYHRDDLEKYADIGVNQISIGVKGNSNLGDEANFNGEETLDYSFDINGIQFLMLDGVSSRSDPQTEGGKILSEQQFNWLINKIEDHQSKGITILATGSSLELGDDDWGWKMGYEEDYNKLRKILNQHDNTLVLTGDIHKNATVKPNDDSVNFYEFVSSGMAKRGNFLVLDISRNKENSNRWIVDYQHYGDTMAPGHKERSGAFTLGSE